VETEISRVRGEIERMEAERKNLANQVAFALLNATITEDYKAQLQVVPSCTSSRFRNAAWRDTGPWSRAWSMWSCSLFPMDPHFCSGVDSCSFRFAACGGDGGGALFRADNVTPSSLRLEEVTGLRRTKPV
jgi:hypothetical protein